MTNLKTSLTSQIKRYLLENPVDDTAKNKYADVCNEFNIDIKLASKCWIDIKNEEVDYFKHYADTKFEEVNYSEKEIKKILKQEGDNLSVTVNTDIEVKSLEDLMLVCEVDDTKWKVISWQCKKWDLGIKNNNNQIETKQLFSVSAKFSPLKIEADLNLQKDIIINELYKYSPVVEYTIPSNNTNRDCLLELALFDVHFGKLAHKEEVGEDYDLKIASARFTSAIDNLLKNVNLDTIERILFPVGQDLINIDNLTNSTTAGTPQDSDSRFHKIVKTVKEVLINTINRLSTIAPVDVVVTTGNHDEQTTFMIGEMLDAYYHNNANVNINNAAYLRKYYQYGITSIMFTHGNREKFNDLGMIFAAENPKLWANTTQRYIQIGHFHHNKKASFLQNQEFQGFSIQIIPSLSGSDAWHMGRGYMSLKQAKAFLYGKTQGLIAEFTHTAK
jgi:hypothetical protein